MGSLSRASKRKRRRAEHVARRAEYLTALETHVCRPGTQPRALTPEELSRPLNAGRSPHTIVNGALDLPVGSEWMCECGKRWVLEWDNSARIDRWREA